MGKGDKKSRKGKITAGSYGNKRRRKTASAVNIPVKVLNEDYKKSTKEKVRKEVGYPTEKSENAEVEKKAKPAAKSKTEKDTKAKEPKDKETED